MEDEKMEQSVNKFKDILQDAFVFTLPLMMVDATSTKLTNTVISLQQDVD